jgi:hydroxyacylglutathione hydrolase
MIAKILDNVFKLSFDNYGSNCYLLIIGKNNIIIDTSSSENRGEIIRDLNSVKINVKEIDSVILTHLHYDHIGNIGLFENAKFYASKEEIKDFDANPSSTVLGCYDSLKKIKIEDVNSLKENSLKVIASPGHTHGSISIYLQKEGILFSGDTLFEQAIGRTDLPTSIDSRMKDSLTKLKNLDFKILCPGH